MNYSPYNQYVPIICSKHNYTLREQQIVSLGRNELCPYFSMGARTMLPHSVQEPS